jgi:hypothetical protein
MATNFPNSLDSLTNPVSTDQLNSPSHSDQHINANDAIEALQAKVGTDNSAVTTSHDYRIRQLELNPVTSTANKIEQVVVNGSSETTLLKGQVVYASGSVGASGKLRVNLSSNSAESTSSKTFGILAENIIPGGEGLLVSEGLLEGIDTTGANDGDPVWLGSTPGSLIFGLINKPVAPSHLVFLGIVVRGGQQSTGSIFVKIQNGFEIEELHNILITDVQDKDALIYDDTTGLWKNYDLTQDFVSSSDVQNSLGDYIPLTALGQPSGPAELNPDGDLLIPQDKIIFEGATADDHELTLQSPDVTSDITVTLPNSTGTIALTSEIPSLTGYATETYADTAASNAQSAAETYADGLAVNYDPAGSASTAEGNANSYTDTQLLSYTPTSSLDSTVDGYGYLKSTDLSGYATETYVDTAVSDLVSSAPETLDTLNELAAALGDDPNYATTITSALGNKLDSSTAASTYLTQTNAALTYAPINSPTFTGIVGGISKSMVGLGNVDNTSDVNKPISTATQNALDLKATLVSPDFTGIPTAPTAAVGTDTTQIATTAFVIDQIDASTQPGSLYQADAPTSPEVGQIWIESDSYSDSFDPNIIRRQSFTATLGQTIFTTAVSFIEGYEQVYFNGLLLLRTTDYTTSGGNTVTLIEAAAADDIIEVVTITNLNSVDVYTQAETDALLAANTSVAPLSISANTNLVAKKRYFVTSASALTLTLPASPALNDEIQILDASGNASTYNITVDRNGNLINGGTGNLIIDMDGSWVVLLYTGSTYGWKVG